MSKRKQHVLEFKAEIALEALKGEETFAQMGYLLQPPARTLGSWRQTTSRALLAKKRRDPT